MEKVIIDRYKLEEIKEVLRQTKNIYRLGTNETCYYRSFNKVNKWVDEILNANSVPQPKQEICFEQFCEAKVHWNDNIWLCENGHRGVK